MTKIKSQQEMRIERALGSWKAIRSVLIVEDIFLWFGLNYILNFFPSLPRLFQDLDHPLKYLGIKNIFPSRNGILQFPQLYIILMVLFILFLAWIDIYQAFRMRTAFSSEGVNRGQKGVERWTTNDEIKEQYQEIPDRDKPFPGYGGTIISRIGENLYIDTTPTNNLIIGITRSGKGEMFVLPSIDVYSRANEKTSLVVTDPKLELYKSSKRTLEERGYDVYLLNLDNPLFSMGFGPLEEIIELYQEKDYSNAELLAQAFSYSIFNPDKPTNSDSFWQDTSSSLLTALILAHIEDCFQQDEIENKQRLHIYQKKRDYFDSLPEDEKIIAREKYQRKKECAESEDIVMDSEIKSLPEEVIFTEVYPNRKKINMYSILNTFTELIRFRINEDEEEGESEVSALDKYFDDRPPLNRAKLKYAGIEVAGYRTKGSIFATMLAKLTIFTYENIAKMTAESSLKMEDIGFGEKPVAVFLGIPDYDKSTHFLATVFIRQMYFVLAKKATRSMSGKCKNRVKVIADEFGNIPPIEGMESIITVCLGRNISFDLFIQDNSQLEKLYGDNAQTIASNCGNHIYILTNDEDTAKKYSEELGNETVIDVQRSGERLSTKKHFMENSMEKPLLNSNELMQLYPGECVIKRVLKRTDLRGNRIQATPIFNSEESGKRFLFRYEYLTNTFPNPDMIDLHEINTEDRTGINLEERVWDYRQTFSQFSMKTKKISRKIKTIGELSNKRQILVAIEQSAGIKDISDDMTIIQLADLISQTDLRYDEKEALLSLLTIGSSGELTK
ncbi:MAG: type IV secretory system conjugative DNA transfer family protein [Lachnospiraceae bacterium]|nr:type IV secretory system conjugative DNA transfer family protein [Lachnospiraceae bacterium]MBP3458902.1 type IV secretory system conjugative DNA transfer family protein [Lachnospiraceae bacterium]